MRLPLKLLLTAAVLLAGSLCIAASVGFSTSRPKPDELTAAARLGRKLFFDKSLSGSGQMACATCHDPRFAYGPPNGKAVQKGGPGLNIPGFRAVPSLRYVLNYVPQWSDVRASNPIEQWTETENVPTGGYTWDGRYNSLHAQALLPLLSPAEMDNRSVTTLAHKLSESPYAAEFRSVFGATVFLHPATAVRDAAMALQQFELQDRSFHPYTSKYDRWLDGKAALTPQELRGKALFDDPNGGNCASCHLDEVGVDGRHPIFTDFQFEALGVPRNNEIPWNSNPHYYDLGLCGPFRKDEASHHRVNCGLFRTPSLRNVAIRKVFFHNGRFHTLRQALEFYVERDTNPARWYPMGPDGKVDKFDDLPPEYRSNVDTTDAPLNRTPAEKPVWNSKQIDDVIAFLKTLTDEDVKNYQAPNASSRRSHRVAATVLRR